MSLQPSNDVCRRVIQALLEEPNLTEWENDFVHSNEERTDFSDKQKESCNRLLEKYDIQ